METLEATASMRGETTTDDSATDDSTTDNAATGSGDLSRRDLLSQTNTGALESPDEAGPEGGLAAIDADEATSTLRASYEGLTDVRRVFRETVDPALFDRIASFVPELTSVDALPLEPAVCLKTFNEERPNGAITLVPHVDETSVVGRIQTVVRTDDAVVTIHAIPDRATMYAVIEPDGEPARLVTATTMTVIEDDLCEERSTGIDCDRERPIGTYYVQRHCCPDDCFVIETTCRARD